jgi:hypothetical protein
MVSIEPGNREGIPGSLTGSSRDIVVIGASRGGIEAIRGIVSALPLSLQSAPLIVPHISPTHASLFPAVLSRAGPLPAEHGRNGLRIADSDEVGRAFRLMSATCSDRSRPAVPIDVGRGGGSPAGRM